MNLALANLTAIHAWKLPALLRSPSRSQTTRPQVVEQPFQHMGKGATITVERALGQSVECLEGCLWITHDGDCRDTVLTQGERYIAQRGARMLIHALEPSISRFSSLN